MRRKMIYKGASMRIVCILDHGNVNSFVLLDGKGHFVRELPKSFDLSNYLKQQKQIDLRSKNA